MFSRCARFDDLSVFSSRFHLIAIKSHFSRAFSLLNDQSSQRNFHYFCLRRSSVRTQKKNQWIFSVFLSSFFLICSSARLCWFHDYWTKCLRILFGSVFFSFFFHIETTSSQSAFIESAAQLNFMRAQRKCYRNKAKIYELRWMRGSFRCKGIERHVADVCEAEPDEE